MIRTLGIIDAVSQSDGTAACSLKRLVRSRVYGQGLVAWISGRVAEAQHLDRVVVAAHTSVAEELRRSTPSYVDIHTSSASDPLEMLLDVTEMYQAQAFVRVGIDNPFVDPELIDHLIVNASKRASCDYISYQLDDGLPVMLSRIGIFAEWCRVRALVIANRQPKLRGERRAITQCLCEHPELFQLAFIRIPQEWRIRDLRLAIDSTYDMEVVDEIIDALGPDRLDLHNLAEFLDRQPALRKRIQESVSVAGAAS